MSELYLTPDEFYDLCLGVAEELGYMYRAVPGHPEDIAINLSTVMTAVAAGFTEAIRRQAKR